MTTSLKKSGIRGELFVTATDRDGNRYTYASPNTLTYGAAKSAAHALMGETAFMVKYLAVGSGTAAPLRTNTALQSEVTRQVVTTLTFPTVNGEEIGQVEFSVFLDYSNAANGSFLTEAGLFADNGTTLIARQIHASIEKTSDFKLEYRWRIVFT